MRGGFGTLCDPVYTGFVEIWHSGEWGSICSSQIDEGNNRLVADVVCRQLGFQHGTRVNPLTSRLGLTDTESDDLPDDIGDSVEEAEEPVRRFWLVSSELRCSGPEKRLVDCELGQGFIENSNQCPLQPHRMHIACRQFPVVEALEAVEAPGAGEVSVSAVSTCSASHRTALL